MFAPAAGEVANQGANQVFSNIGNFATGSNALVDGTLSGASGGLFDGFLNTLGNEQLGNVLDAGFKGYGAIKNMGQQDKLMDLMGKQEARAADAYSRDREADDRRRLLTF